MAKAKGNQPAGYRITAVKRAIREDKLNPTARETYEQSVKVATDRVLLDGIADFTESTSNYGREVLAIMIAERDRRGLK